MSYWKMEFIGEHKLKQITFCRLLTGALVKTLLRWLNNSDTKALKKADICNCLSKIRVIGSYTNYVTGTIYFVSNLEPLRGGLWF